MRRMNIETVFRLRLPYQPGQFARVAQVVAEEKGLLGELRIVRLGEDHTVRDIAVETVDDEHTRRIEARIRALPGIDLLSMTDMVFARHAGGKIHSTSRVPLDNISDLRQAYTPGVARVSLAIQADPAQAWTYTSLGRSVGIFTNGTRVLGLGDIGPLASLPVMEGKAVLYDKFAGLSATPILVDSKDPGEFIETVVRVAPSFGAVHLEDIRSPDCFRIEDELIRRLRKPVMHDDQHGTAVVALAALENACRLVSVALADAQVGQIGLGAAGSAIARLALARGVRQVVVSDPNPEAVRWLEGLGAHGAGLDELLRTCDVVIAATGRPGLIRPEQVRKGQIIFALSNPVPEIDSQVARDAGAAFASDGKSVNNALAFPGLFRGALACRASRISAGMKLAAVKALADLAEPGELVPDPLDPRVHAGVAHAVEQAALSEGLAGTAQLR